MSDDPSSSLPRELDPVLIHPKRLLIMSLLMGLGRMAPAELKERLNITWGSLASHLQKLEDVGFILQLSQLTEVGKRKSIEITSRGVSTYQSTLDTLSIIIGNKDG